MSKLKIYLASPYSHPEAQVREYRFAKACVAAGALFKKGYIVFSPIAHTHSIALKHDLPKGIEFWEELDRSFIEWADAVVVLVIGGTEESKGIAREVEIANSLGKRIHYFHLDEIQSFPPEETYVSQCT